MQQIDIVIIGAGLSGIGAACHLSRQCPDKTFLILEGRERIGGTWDLFRYPGIRSDSDMYTLGYNFKPWTDPKSIADGPSIQTYIEEAAREYGLEERIYFGHKVKSAAWSTPQSHWTLQVEDTTTGMEKQFTCNFVFSCTGYYNYTHGYTPTFPGSDTFEGDIIHPQHWPDDYDYASKKVVVIGSGATAITLVPAMAEKAAHVTMLQRSATYLVTVPREDRFSNGLRRFLPSSWVYRITRTRNTTLVYVMYTLSKLFPNFVRRIIVKAAVKQAGPGTDPKHFEPPYNPWDERICVVPDGDFFQSIRAGDVSIVTDQIERFTKNGIQLKTGDALGADMIVTATGLDLQFMGGIELKIDDEPFDDSTKLNYKGAMIEGLPNMGFVFGYTNASWTLKADLTAEYLCRVINIMDRKEYRKCMPVNTDPSIRSEPFINLKAGYVKRGIGRFPSQGNKRPWRLYQNYFLDLLTLRYGRIFDGRLTFSCPEETTLESDDPTAVGRAS
jgi:cation diffusion facilitator CzcD-associated flavoprotein CzcO